MRFFRRSPKQTQPPVIVPKVVPAPKPRFSLLGLFRRNKATPPPTVAVMEIPPPPSTNKWRFFRRTPDAQPIIVEVLPEAIPPKPTGLRRLFSRGRPQLVTTPQAKQGLSYFISQLFAIIGWTGVAFALGWGLLRVNSYTIKLLPNAAPISQATMQAAEALTTRAAIIKTVQANSTAAFQTADAANRQTVVAEVILATRQAAEAGQTATTIVVQQTQTAVVMQRGATATDNAIALNLSERLRTATAAQQSSDSTRIAAMRQATLQVGAAQSSRRTLPPDCLTPALVMGVLAITLKLKYSQP